MNNILVKAKAKSGVTSYLCYKMKRENTNVELLEECLTVSDYFKRHQRVHTHRTISSLCSTLATVTDKEVRVLIDPVSMLTNTNIKLLIATMVKFKESKNISFMVVLPIDGKDAKKTNAFLKLVKENDLVFDEEYTIVRDNNVNIVQDKTGKTIKDITSIVKDGFKPLLR